MVCPEYKYSPSLNCISYWAVYFFLFNYDQTPPVFGYSIFFVNGISFAYLIANILGNHAFLLLDALHIFGILPAELWRQWYNDGRYPYEEYHQEHSTTGSRMDVIDIRYGPVSVNAAPIGWMWSKIDTPKWMKKNKLVKFCICV